MPFRPAQKEVGYVKGAIYGPPGSGKTVLTALLLIYLSKTYHKSAPVAWLASEKGVDFVIDIFAAEGVPLLVQRSRSFLDLKNSHEEALKDGCCGLGVDSTTHFWRELLSSGMKRGGRQLEKIQRVKEEWDPFAADFQDMPIHSLATGRLGYKWEDVEVENSEGEIVKELSKNGTKMKAETDFGHEPDLEIEMSAVEDPDFIKFEKIRGRARRNFKSVMIHAATLKKSRVWALNGQAFTWKDQPNYKPGYYKTVAECFKPHFDAINIGGIHHVSDTTRPNSTVLFQNRSEQSYHELVIKKAEALENWYATMDVILPGRTDEGKRQRMVITEAITGVRSKTRFESYDLQQLLQCVGLLLAFELRCKHEKWTLPLTKVQDADLLEQLKLAKEDFRQGFTSDATLLEVLAQRSLDQVRGNGHAQPAIHLIDRVPADELQVF